MENRSLSAIHSMKTVIVASVGLICTLICALGTVCEGLELLFLLPLAFVIARIVFSRAFSYITDNIALTIIFVSIYVRYLATPLLMTLAKTGLTTVNVSANGYRLAVFIEVLELFVVMAIIDRLWTRYKRRNRLQHKAYIVSENPVDFRLSLLGIAFIAALVFLVLSRGRLSNVISHYSSWWYVSEDFSDVYFYDLMAIEVSKSVVTVFLISLFARGYHKCSSVFSRGFFFLLAFAVGIASTMFYQYSSRTALAQLIISVMVTLIAFFPKRRRLITCVVGVGGVAFLAYVFASGSMRDVTGGGNDTLLESMAKMAELYVSGPSMVGATQDRLELVRSQMSVGTFFSDIINTTHVFGLVPGLRNITSLVSGIPTSNQLFVDSLNGLTYILPNYSFWTYYGGNAFGWLLEIISMYVTVKMICVIESQKAKHNNAAFYYAMAYAEVLLGQAVFVNNSFLFWHAFTNIPFWLLVFWGVNTLGNKFSITRLVR